MEAKNDPLWNIDGWKEDILERSEKDMADRPSFWAYFSTNPAGSPPPAGSECDSRSWPGPRSAYQSRRLISWQLRKRHCSRANAFLDRSDFVTKDALAWLV